MENVMALARISSNEPGVYYLNPADASIFGFTGTPDSIHGWKERYAFVKTEYDCEFSTIFRVTQGLVLRVWLGTTTEVDRLYARLRCKHICLNLKKGNLITRAESPAQDKKEKRKAEEGGEGGEGGEVPPAALPKRRKSTRGLKPVEPMVVAPVSSRAPVPSDGPRSSSVEDSTREEEEEEDFGFIPTLGGQEETGVADDGDDDEDSDDDNDSGASGVSGEEEEEEEDDTAEEPGTKGGGETEPPEGYAGGSSGEGGDEGGAGGDSAKEGEAFPACCWV